MDCSPQSSSRVDEGLMRGLMADADCERRGKRHATTDGSVKLVLKV